jgi:hypothetical protein
MKIFAPTQRLGLSISNTYKSQNAAIVTVLNAVTGLLQESFGVLALNQGEYLDINIFVRMLKGATAGVSYVRLSDGGGLSCKVEGISDDYFLSGIGSTLWQRISVTAADTVIFSMGGLYKVLSNGSKTLSLVGLSAGSNSTVAAGDAQMKIVRYAA